jgi:hypothetical protein
MTSLTFLRLGLRSETMGRARAISLGATLLMTLLGLVMGARAGAAQAELGAGGGSIWGVVAALSLAAHYQGRMKVSTAPEERDFLASIHIGPGRLAWLKLMQQTGGGGWLTGAGPAALTAWLIATPGSHWYVALPLWPLLHLAMGQLVQGIYVWVEDAGARRWYHKLLKASLILFGLAGMLAVYGSVLAPEATQQVGLALGRLGGAAAAGALTGTTPVAVLQGAGLLLFYLAVAAGLGRLLAVRGYALVLRAENAERHLHRRQVAPPRALLRDRSPFAAHLGKNLTLLTRVGGQILLGLAITSVFLLGVLWFFTRGIDGEEANPILLRVLSASMLALFAYMLSAATGTGMMRQDTGWLGIIRAAGQLPAYLAAQVVAGILLALPSLLLLAGLAAWILQLPALPLMAWGAEAVALMVPVNIWAHALSLRLGGDPSQPTMMAQLPMLLALYPVMIIGAAGAALGWWVLTLVLGPLAAAAGVGAAVHAAAILRTADLP